MSDVEKNVGGESVVVGTDGVSDKRKWHLPRTNGRLHLLLPLAILLVTLCEYRVIRILERPGAFDMLRFVEGVTTGTTGFRGFQNRILGPWIVKAVSDAAHCTFERACRVVEVALLLAANVTAFLVVSRLTRRESLGLLYCFIHASLTVLVYDDYCSYIWDYIVPIETFLFAYGIFTKKGMGYYVPIFLVGILNREQALFIPLWLCLEAVRLPKPEACEPRGLRLDVRKFAVGCALLVLGIAYVKLSRDLLFVKSFLPEVGLDMEHKILGNHWQLGRNARELVENFSTGTIFQGGDTNAYCILAYLVYAFFRYRRWYFTERVRVLILLACEIAAIVLVGLVFETRVWFAVLALLVVCDAVERHVTGNAEAPAQSSDGSRAWSRA